MLCGRCCVTEPRSRLPLRLDIFIEILLGSRVNRGAVSQHGTIVASIGGCLTRAEAALTRTRFSSRPESPQGLAPLAGEVARTKLWRSVTSDGPRTSRRQ